MLEHTKRQVPKWKFLQHALSRYVYNRSLFDIFTQGTSYLFYGFSPILRNVDTRSNETFTTKRDNALW